MTPINVNRHARGRGKAAKASRRGSFSLSRTLGGIVGPTIAGFVLAQTDFTSLFALDNLLRAYGRVYRFGMWVGLIGCGFALALLIRSFRANGGPQMIRRIRCWMVAVAWLGLISISAAAQDGGLLDAVRGTSESLVSYSATIQMTQHTSRGESTIRFSFDFVPPDRMRMAYEEPASVDGQTMILNADRFYTYLPSLGRRVWRDVDEGSNDQGEEMGFLYDFVTRRAAAFCEANSLEATAESDGYVLEETGASLDVVELTFGPEAGRGRSFGVNRAGRHACRGVDIYVGDDPRDERTGPRLPPQRRNR